MINGEPARRQTIKRTGIAVLNRASLFGSLVGSFEEIHP